MPTYLSVRRREPPSIANLIRAGVCPPLPAFDCEAGLLAALESRDLSADDVAAARARGVGIAAESHLGRLRAWLVATGAEGDDVELWTWGTDARSGRALSAAVGRLARGGIRRALDWPTGDEYALLEQWLAANGVTHHRAIAAAHALFEGERGKVAPRVRDATLGPDAVHLARVLADGNPRLAAALFRCLARIVGVARDGQVMWSSSWLRGRGASRDAIVGASSYQRELPAILHEHVLERVSGHAVGRRAAIYRLRRDIPRGSIDAARAAHMLGVRR